MEEWLGALEGMAVKQPKEISFWTDRSVLVTGGAGFIGFALVKSLQSHGARVVVLDIKKGLPDFHVAHKVSGKKIAYVRGSVVSKAVVTSVLKKYKIQTIFHLAAEAIVGRALENPEKALDTNVRGTWNLLECVRASKYVQETIVASSDKAYGSHAKLPYVEDAPLDGENPYDVSKSAADLIAKSYAKTFRLPLAIARCGNVYGPGDLNWSRLIPDALRSGLKNAVLKLRSNGKFARDYVYVEDIVSAYMTLAAQVCSKSFYGEAFNFGTREAMTVMEVVEGLRKASGMKIETIVLDAARYEIEAQYLDSSKAERLLGWKPRVDREEGFKRTAQWYLSYLA